MLPPLSGCQDRLIVLYAAAISCLSLLLSMPSTCGAALRLLVGAAAGDLLVLAEHVHPALPPAMTLCCGQHGLT